MSAKIRDYGENGVGGSKYEVGGRKYEVGGRKYDIGGLNFPDVAKEGKTAQFFDYSLSILDSASHKIFFPKNQNAYLCRPDKKGMNR